MGRPKRMLNLCQPIYAAYVPELVETLRALGHREAGAVQHGRQLRLFLHWLESRGLYRIGEVRAATLLDYRLFLLAVTNLNDGGNLHPKTIYGHLRTVRLLVDLLLETGRLQRDPFSGFYLRHPNLRPRREILTQAEVQSLYAACDTLGQRALLGLNYGCGLRACELERVAMDDLRFAENILIVPSGKNARRRVIPMGERVRLDLLAYHRQQRNRRREPNRAFLLNERGGRLRAYTANKRLGRLAEQSGILHKPVTTHVLRHSIATHLLENGLAVERVRRFLGHSLLATTEIYTHVSADQLQEMAK